MNCRYKKMQQLTGSLYSHYKGPVFEYRHRLEFALGGTYLRPKGPNSKPKAKRGGRRRERFLERGSDPSPNPLGIWGAVLALPAMFGMEPRPQMHFGRTKNAENSSCGRKYRLIPTDRFDSVFVALAILDFWGRGHVPLPSRLATPMS